MTTRTDKACKIRIGGHAALADIRCGRLRAISAPRPGGDAPSAWGAEPPTPLHTGNRPQPDASERLLTGTLTTGRCARSAAAVVRCHTHRRQPPVSDRSRAGVLGRITAWAVLRRVWLARAATLGGAKQARWARTGESWAAATPSGTAIGNIPTLLAARRRQQPRAGWPRSRVVHLRRNRPRSRWSGRS